MNLEGTESNVLDQSTLEEESLDQTTQEPIKKVEEMLEG